MGGRAVSIAVFFAVLLAVGSASFVFDATRGNAEPIPFEGTNEGGLPFSALYEARQTDAVIPRAEAFYAQYQYVVGYNGIPFLLADLHQSAQSREFGRLLTVYVTDFTDAGVRVRADGTLVASSESAIDWIPVTDAYFVVDSRAQTTDDIRAIVPFSDRSVARRFARQYNGTILRWNALRERRYDDLARSESEWERTVSRRLAWANRTEARALNLEDRPVSVVVGRDAPTLSSAVERAPPNTTVRIPPGRYNVTDLRVSKPITIEGSGPNRTFVSGDGEGSVVNVTASRVGIVGLRIDGVGTNASVGRTLVDPDDRYYKTRISYGRGDSGVVFSRAPGSLVANVTVETPTHGVLVRDSPSTVITGTTVYGPPRAENTSIGISVMSSRVLIQDSSLYGGFHSTIIHNTSGIVVRNLSAEGAVTGFHGLYTRRGLVTNSTFRDMFKPVMTATEGSGNAAVGNDVRNAALGIDFAGSRSYVARNLVIHNGIGMIIEGRGTLYTDNVIGDNRVGVQVGNPFPTNRITGNDFVVNDQHVKANDEVVLYVWTVNGRGNYWGGFDRFDRDDDGSLDGPIRPTSPAGKLSYGAPGGATIVRSNAVTLLRALQTLVPGLRSGGVIDTAPVSSPTSPQQFEILRTAYSTDGPYTPSHDSDPYDYRAAYDVPHSENDTYG